VISSNKRPIRSRSWPLRGMRDFNFFFVDLGIFKILLFKLSGREIFSRPDCSVSQNYPFEILLPINPKSGG